MSFASRHIGLTAAEVDLMLGQIGVGSMAELIEQTVPASIRTAQPLDLPEARSEQAVARALREMANENDQFRSLIGLGYSDCVTPAVIRRNILENPAWYTGYTPYQPEISQGRLEMLLRFQTMVSELTSMEIANASLLDEPTAIAEAVAMAQRVRRTGSTVVVMGALHPANTAVLRTRASGFGWNIVTMQPGTSGECDEDVFAVIVQSPDTTGMMHDIKSVRAWMGESTALLIVATDLLACTLTTPPGESGADIAVGSAQRFGVPLFFGGPHAGFLATRSKFQRQLPGRLVGVSQDASGARALRLTLQAREQHIRRESATSNICTAQVLLANTAAAYAMWHGPRGLHAIAARIHDQATRLRAALRSAGFDTADGPMFDTVTIHHCDAASLSERAAKQRINVCVQGERAVSIALDETTDEALLCEVAAVFGAEVVRSGPGEGEWAIGEPRSSRYLEHDCFDAFRSETAMMRELRRLADLDLALDRTMIPLGSCTMKLNAAVEMEGISLAGFASIHPYAPGAQTRGYRQLIDGLSEWLCEITGYDAVSLQPNAGSQGELAGLLAIKAYHQSRSEVHRDICLIPESAHGTNAASAAMAGMETITIACDIAGNVDVDDLKRTLETYGSRVAAIMVTYPSTHGVFEAGIVSICEMVHAAGGQVYIDGANLNAMVGLAKPGLIGGDVSHLNLHKTFCIPHGGGGPGVGPVAVREHLAPYLPNHPLRSDAGPVTGVGAISGAPFGSAGILPISWAYIALMGPQALTWASEHAILSANYLASRLDDAYPVLYRGNQGKVAHECILDIRPIAQTVGVTAEDICKRLIDFGFHAPTMSFPVPGTLMIEPTESEPKEEIDRFIDAMLTIRAEIEAIEQGAVALADSPLRNAPHTLGDLVETEWDRPYSQQQAVLPDGSSGASKYWPPVGRIDNAYGDRNIFCSCS